MTLAALSPDWQMTALFFVFLLPLCGLMKMAAFRRTEHSRDWMLLLAPFPTPASVKRALPLSAWPRLLVRFVVASALCIGGYLLYWATLREFRPPVFVLSYFGAVILWLLSEALGSVVVFLGLPSGRLLPLPHGGLPPLARSVSDFWGRRWNVWTSDWFRQVIFRPLRSKPVLAVFIVFGLSGLFHDWVINVPLYLVTGRNSLGSMTAYFLLQAVGVMIERNVKSRAVRVLLVWLFVFGASPLMVNEGLLRILHLWPGE